MNDKNYQEEDEPIDEVCPECNGKGTIEVINCRNNSNDCCGGCYKDVPCPECDGEGVSND